jgi:hypothetical protein
LPPLPLPAGKTLAPPPEDILIPPYISPEAGKPLSSRSLTAGEEALARTLFGDKLDLEDIRLDFYRADGKLLSKVEPGETRNIEFFGAARFSADFSTDKDPRRFGAFVEELTHLWQNQDEGAGTHGKPDTKLYKLDGVATFRDFGAEQQAEIMEDYALRFLHPSRQTRWLTQEYGGDFTTTDPWLARLVEAFSSSAYKARMADVDAETRALTGGEDTLIHGIFGAQLDTDGVMASFYPEAFKDAAATTVSGESALFWGNEQKSADFSKEKDDDRFAYFVHEMTHVWQYQQGLRYTDKFVDNGVDDPDDPMVSYLYPVDSQHKFTDYGIEQQAAIIEDYARLYLRAPGQLRYLSEQYSGEELEAKLPLLQKLVEDQFPEARRARLDFAARHPSTPEAPPDAPPDSPNIPGLQRAAAKTDDLKPA